MKAHQLMTAGPACCTKETTLRFAAKLMSLNNCGCLPVVGGNQMNPVGMITDRDIALSLADSKGEDTLVREIVKEGKLWFCNRNDDVERAAELMQEGKVRRIIVVDDDGMVVGIVSLGDLAQKWRQPTIDIDGIILDILELVTDPDKK